MRISIATLVLVTGLTSAADAQRMPQFLSQPTPHTTQQRPDTGSHETAMITGGVLGVLGGTLGGAIGGMGIERALNPGCDHEEYCGLAGFVLGPLVGEPLGVALGVHVASGRRGNVAASYLASTGLLILGLALGSQVNNSHGCRDCGTYLVLIGVPVTQIAASIAIENATARKEGQ